DGKKAFEAEIAKLEKQIKEDTNLKPEVKKKLEEILEEAKKEKETLKTSDEFKEATKKLNTKVEEAKKNTNPNPGNQSGGQGGNNTTPTKPVDKKPKPSLEKVSAWNAAFNYSVTGEDIGRRLPNSWKEKKEYDFWKNLNIDAIINSSDDKKPATPPATPMPPANKPAEEDTNQAEVDKVVKESKDILVLGKEAKEAIEELKKDTDNKKYTLWYDRNNTKIVMSEGTNPPFGRKFHGKKWEIFDFAEKVKNIGKDIQLVNSTAPTFKVQRNNKEFTNLSSKLDFKFDDKKENIIVEYKIGKFIKGKDPKVSKDKNTSTVSLKK
ncbi:hypothetical protein, partial [Metamycoplasma auris]|uniref:hypothetical protein n=1 Tax=Metamycoplasma auris TaxID=51363 RepID=UPI00068CE629